MALWGPRDSDDDGTKPSRNGDIWSGGAPYVALPFQIHVL